METEILQRFERQVDALIARYEKLKNENNILRRENTSHKDRVSSLVSENEQYQKKNEATIARVESIINKLQSIENADGQLAE